MQVIMQSMPVSQANRAPAHGTDACGLGWLTSPLPQSAHDVAAAGTRQRIPNGGNRTAAREAQRPIAERSATISALRF